MHSSQDCKRILVVGGGAGIGASIIHSISISAGTDDIQMVVFDRNLDHISSVLSNYPFNGRKVECVLGDVRSPRDRSLVMEKCEQFMGGIDTLIYCAGVITPIERIEKLDMEQVKETFDVNVFGCMTMVQLCLPSIRQSRITHPFNAGFGKIIILSSACDASVTYHGWSPYCTTKAALTRFVSCIAHEEPLINVQGVYPKLTRTKMPEDVIAGKYRGVMADHEIERFKVWDDIGNQMVEPPDLCGHAVARLALGLVEGGRSGETLYYDEHVPTKVVGT